MTRVLIYSVLCANLGLAGSACTPTPERAAVDRPAKDQIEVTGCLTGNSALNQYVVTANADAMTSLGSRAADGTADTFSYLLEGGDNLPAHVGREVIAKGVLAGDAQVVRLERKEEESVEASAGRKASDAEVALKQEVELRVRPLKVSSVMPTGAECK